MALESLHFPSIFKTSCLSWLHLYSTQSVGKNLAIFLVSTINVEPIVFMVLCLPPKGYRTCPQGTHPPEAEKGLECIAMWQHSLNDGSKAQRRKPQKASWRSLERSRPSRQLGKGVLCTGKGICKSTEAKEEKVGPTLGAGGTKIKRHTPSPLGAYSLIGKADNTRQF